MRFVAVRRKQLLNRLEHPKYVRDISLQPGTNGHVFVSACGDDILRLFDARQSVTGNSINKVASVFYFIVYCLHTHRFTVPVFQDKKYSWSVVFSPAHPMIVASGDLDGAKLYDIRQNSFRYQKIGIINGSGS